MKKVMKVLALALAVICIGAAANTKRVVVLDVGHGGRDAGATLKTTFEKDMCLKVAQKVQALAEKSDIEVVLTRNEDEFKSLADRVAFVKRVNPDALISLHVNSSKDGTKKGFEIYVNGETENLKDCEKLADRLLQNMPNRTEQSTVKKGKFYLLSETECPGAILELGYLSNDEDMAYLTSEEGQNELALAIFNSIKE